MSGVSFDPVAHRYDATRGYDGAIAQQIAQGLDRVAQGEVGTSYLEMGVGTGRIAIPLAELGRSVTGVDISPKMLGQLEAKLLRAGWQEQGADQLWGSLPDEESTSRPTVQRFRTGSGHAAIRLIVSDITQLPLHDNAFDAVIGVHIFHLVPEWKQALQEAQRVLRPGGVLVLGWDRYDENAPSQFIMQKWRHFVRELGVGMRPPGMTEDDLLAWLREQEVQSDKKIRNEEPEELVRWQYPVVPRQVVETIAQRVWSGSWDVPDNIFTSSIEALRTWAQEYYGSDIDVEQLQERRFFARKVYLK